MKCKGWVNITVPCQGHPLEGNGPWSAGVFKTRKEADAHDEKQMRNLLPAIRIACIRVSFSDGEGVRTNDPLGDWKAANSGRRSAPFEDDGKSGMELTLYSTPAT